MDVKRRFIFLLLFLAACSGPAQGTGNLPDTEQAAEPAEQAVVATEAPEIVQPTATQNQEAAETPVEAKGQNSEEWHLVASYQYIGNTTPTDILYTWEAWFSVAQDGTLVALDQVGWAEGQAGLNYNGECIEAQPVTLDWNYDFSGKITAMEVDRVEEIFGQVDGQINQDGNVEMFEFTFANPDIFEYNLSPFACAPDLDENFLRSLGTYWVTTVPVMSPDFRTVPAQEGMFCQPVLSFEEDGLGTLVPCYLLEK